VDTRAFANALAEAEGHCFYLFVNFAPVPNARYLHLFLFVINSVDYAIVANADTPRILSTT